MKQIEHSETICHQEVVRCNINSVHFLCKKILLILLSVLLIMLLLVTFQCTCNKRSAIY